MNVEDMRATLHELRKYGLTGMKLQDLCGMRYGEYWWDIYLFYLYLMEN
jgi:hypothetical protein